LITRKDWSLLWANKLKAPSIEISDKVDQTIYNIRVIKAIATTPQVITTNHERVMITTVVVTNITIHVTPDVIEKSVAIN